MSDILNCTYQACRIITLFGQKSPGNPDMCIIETCCGSRAPIYHLMQYNGLAINKSSGIVLKAGSTDRTGEKSQLNDFECACCGVMARRKGRPKMLQ